jgi:hypothetical protein
MTPLRIALALAAALLAAPAAAREVGGADIPEEARGAGVAEPLRLNGAGVRRKLLFALYAIGLYLPAPESDPARVLALDGPRRVLMRILYKEISREQLVAAWNEAFVANHSPAELAPLQARIDRFNAAFESLHAGDTVLIDYLPGKGTRLEINGRAREEIPGADFAAALLRIWLGPAPVSSGLKAELLGR